MELNKNKSITVQTIINLPAEKVWKFWTNPADIMKWNNASDDWHTTRAENDLRVGGKFLSRMEAKDGSVGFDFVGTYSNVKTNEKIEYEIMDGRKVMISFSGIGKATKVTETFEAENTHSVEMQQNGWQSILNNFKKYAETKG